MLQGIGLVVVALGIVGLIWGIFQKVKAGRVSDAPLATTGDVTKKGKAVCGPKGQISAQGNVSCPKPVVAPFSGTPCLYYHIKCTAEWKEGDNNKSKILDEQKVAAQFSIDDGSGAVWIDAREGGDFEPSQRKSDVQGTGILGGITGKELTFGSYRVQTGVLAMGTKFRVEEEILPVVPRLYACGKLAEQGGSIAAPGWRSLILSNKSRDELLASATKSAKTFLIGGAAAFVVGSAMSLIGQLFFPGEADKPVAPIASASEAPETKAAPPPTMTATATATSTETSPAAATAVKPVAGKPTASAAASAKPDAGASPKASASPSASASASASAKKK